MTTYQGDIPGDLTLKKGDDAAALTSVGGSVYVRPGATFDAARSTLHKVLADVGEVAP